MICKPAQPVNTEEAFYLQVVLRMGEGGRHCFCRSKFPKVDLTLYVIRLRTIVPSDDTMTMSPNLDRR